MTVNTSSSLTGLRGLVAIAALGALPATLCTASAADPSSASITVNYSDLDIKSPSGARLLYERIRAASQSACNYFWFKTDADEAKCRQNTIAKAVSKINHPALTAVYNAKYKISA